MLTKEKIAELGAALDATLKAFGEAHGLKVSRGGINYSQNNFSCKLEAVVDGGLSKEQEAYEINRGRLQLPPRGTTFTDKGKTYCIDGLTGRGKIVLLCGSESFTGSIESVRRLIAKEVAAPASTPSTSVVKES